MYMNKLPLLMTASVSKRGMVGACFTDEEREKMYRESLMIYEKMLIGGGKTYKIVFVDNSSWDLSSIKSSVKENPSIEFLSLDSEDFDVTKGKGYNELLLINKAVEKSVFIREAGGFFKVTGRYPIYNIKYFIDYASKFILERRGHLYIDIKDHNLYDRLGLGWCGHSADVRMFAASLSFYNEFIGNRYVELNDYKGLLLEGLMYEIVKSLIHRSDVICRFKKEPHFGGLEGSNVAALSFSKNQDSLKGKLKRFLGNIIRLFFPRFWF